ncbi:ABC transporter permease [Polaribacter porphyrae]|uniref:ABC transporter permease n=1 Tax=Polaribacter porphyrae TaxID=1137780 RepID=A0A2S7WK68_9FLAO|nr:DUF3526 domain-containing protein [Polaribacter porphyrae]PQJ77973.1 hypothetical protein BTO18_01675 [Polaribacter porphyrae]
MLQIIKNEWQFLTRSKIFLGIAIGFFSILIVSVYFGNLENEKLQSKGNDAKKHLREKWVSIEEMNPHSAAHYGTYIFKPTNLLSSLDDGVTSVTGNVIKVEGHVQNEIVHSAASQSQVISRFGKLKSSLLLQYIVPLLLIFLAFNSISSEKQSGRLKLLILQGAKPTKLILAKTLSVWLYGLVLLLIVVVTYAFLNVDNINTEILSRTLLFFSTYLLYYFVVTGLTIFFSIQFKTPTLGLTTMLGIWILWTIFLPNILMSSVENWYSLPTRNEFKTAMKEDRAKGLDGHNPSDERGKELEQSVLREYKVDSLHKLPINFDGIRMQADEEYGNIVWDKHFGNNKMVMQQQKKSFQFAGILNPFISLQNSSMGFAASDNLHHQEFLLQVENYRRVFIKMLNDKHTFGGSKTGDWSWKADNAFFKSVPDFEYKPTKINQAISNYLIDILVLIIWSILIIFLLLYASKKNKIV